MNWVAVVLGIIIIILLYVLFKYFTINSSTLAANANLMTNVPDITSINSPTSARYAYGIWVYVNTWNSTVRKTIFKRNNNIELYLDTTSPSLKCDIALSNNTKNTLIITDNFPIQKWTYVIVSVDTQFVDCYLDGKLSLSRKLDSLPKTPPDSSTHINLGVTNTPIDISIMGFQRWTAPIDPQTAWNSYMEKSGSGQMGSIFSSYGINLNILQDNVLTNTYKLY